MMRTARLLAALGGCFLPIAASAQDAAGWIDELRELRKMVEAQNKKIDALTAQVSRLSAALDGKPAAEKPAAEGAAASSDAAAPATAPAGHTAGAEEFSATAPKAEPAAPQHVVMKGETLTSIAKHYNVSLSDLMKANKGLNERKLQIGQSINLPLPPQTPPKTSEPKANP
jgi:LysM repeat protein